MELGPKLLGRFDEILLVCFAMILLNIVLLLNHHLLITTAEFSLTFFMTGDKFFRLFHILWILCRYCTSKYCFEVFHKFRFQIVYKSLPKSLNIMHDAKD